MRSTRMRLGWQVRSFALVCCTLLFLACGGDSSTPPVTAPTAPTITVNPRNLTVVQDHEAPFNVVATGTAPLSYQWRKNGSSIAGATRPSYVLSTAPLSDSGADFSVVVSNAAGSVTSASARLTVSPPPVGHTYYLDAQGGSDASGDGSQAQPYRSVAKLWPQLAAGDLVLLASGNYPKFVAGKTWPSNSTDLGWNCTPVDVFPDWVTFRAAPGQAPHFAAIDLGTWNATPDTGAMPWSQVGNSDAYLRFDGFTVDDGVSIAGSRHVEVKNCVIHRLGDLTGSLDNMNNKPGVWVTNGRYITIEGNEISHVAIGVSAMTTDFILRGNEIHDNSHDGMRIYGGDNLLIEGNRFHDLDDGVDDSSGLDWNMHVDGIQIFINNYAPKMATDLNGLTIRGNVFYHLEAMGIMVNGTSPPTTNYRNFVFENNIMGPVGGNLLHWGSAIEGFIFRHNTIVYTPNTTWTSLYRTLDGSKYNVSWWPDGNGKMVYNNIFVDGKSSQPDPGSSSFALVANNLYKDAPWNTLERGSALITTLPYTAGDWTATLLAGSQAIDGGTRLGADFTPLSNQLDIDIDGTARDNRPDIGAYEVQGRNPPAETAATYGH